MSKIPQENLGEALEAAVREAVDDKTFQKVKRCSYAPGSQDVSSPRTKWNTPLEKKKKKKIWKDVTWCLILYLCAQQHLTYEPYTQLFINKFVVVLETHLGGTMFKYDKFFNINN